MSYVQISGAARSGIADRLAGVFSTVSVALRKRRLYAQTYRELAVLTERELSDLGISRAMIKDIAAEAAYGK